MAQKTGRVSSKQLAQELATEGGFTVHEQTGERPASGYAVADFGAERIIPSPGAQPADVENYRQTFSEQLAGPRKFFGGWREGSSGSDYLDTSTIVGTRREAFSVGQQTAQRAVFDLSTFTEHSVPFKPGLPGPGRTGMTSRQYRDAEATNRELGRRMVENQLIGRQDPTQAKERGAAIADDLFAREELHQQVRGRSPRAQVKRGK